MAEVTVVAHDVGPVGGMERQLTELIGGLTRSGHTVTVIARRCDLSNPAVRHIRVRGPARPFVLAYPWFLAVGSLLVARHRRGVVQSTGAIVFNRVDVLAVHLCHRAFRATGLLRARRRRVTYLINARLAGWMSRVGERVCFPRATALAAVSEGIAREVRDAFPELASRVTVVPNGVDVDRFAPSAEGRRPRSAIFVGGEWDGKGLDFAIKALAHAPGWSLNVIGDGDRERFAALARAGGVEERVHFHGRRPDPERHYATACAFVLPSVYETFSLVTYEAAASGVPLLATRVSGIEDLLDDGVNGWFIERDADGISERLRQLDDPDLVERMGQAARQSVLEYGWERSVTAHTELYERLLRA